MTEVKVTEQLFVVGEWILGDVERPPEKIGSIFVPNPKETAKEEKTKRVKITAIGDRVERRGLQVGDIVIVHQSATILKCEQFGCLFKEGNIMAIVGRKEEIVEDSN